MLKKKSFVLILVNVVLALLISGCMNKSQPTRFYTLTSTVERQKLLTESSASRNLPIGIGPIKLADYLNTSKIITRIDENKIGQAAFDQWSGSLKNNIINIMADNIGSLLNTEKVFIHPWRSFIPIDYQVIIEIIRFDGDLNNEVTLVARWLVLNDKDKSIIDNKRSSISETTDTPDYAGLVAAQSRALGKLSKEIAQSIDAASLK
ncbi:PqiC family protein [Desulfosediminicola flagellatus]|uniref:PqiC family protein n=1 Tax=Desulfosediminicola flagellatus TaxID=2569541 RepID=UPI0010ACED79|nr:PqiC family protein [Desulfosediminicola flagellatus]